MHLLLLTAALFIAQPPVASPGNRLAYLDETNPYYPHRQFAKLTTPMWVGEPDVEAVVILAIDDLRDSKKYETYLRPILNRLKAIDGRAPVSIMSCKVEPDDPQLAAWLKEGLSLECHTFDHPCPFYKIGFDKSKETYEKCIDLLAKVPGNRPVAFRMPCCDSLNTPSPRFFAGIMGEMTPGRHRLWIDSSVFNIFTPDDPALKDLFSDEGPDRFRRYSPADRSFVNTIENYPYPYIIAGKSWQFPCVTPSDWQAQHRHKPNNPITVADWKAVLDGTVRKQGTFNLVFHPHGWIMSEQVVEFIDHAQKAHGKKVKFLTFAEAFERLSKNIGVPDVTAPLGVALMDLDNDGYLDIVKPERDRIATRRWSPRTRNWHDADLPVEAFHGESHRSFGILQKNGLASFVQRARDKGIVAQQVWHFTGSKWVRDTDVPSELPLKQASDDFVNFRLRDLDGDGVCETIGGNGMVAAIRPGKGWIPYAWEVPTPPGPRRKFLDSARFLDLDGDGQLDLLISDEQGHGIWLFTNAGRGWAKRISSGGPGAFPLITRRGEDNGFWMHSGHLWWANEDTHMLRDFVDRRKISDLLSK